MVGGVEIIDNSKLNSTKPASPPAIHIPLALQFNDQWGGRPRLQRVSRPAPPTPESTVPRSTRDSPQPQARRPPRPPHPAPVALAPPPALETNSSAPRAAACTNRNTCPASRTAIRAARAPRCARLPQIGR